MPIAKELRIYAKDDYDLKQERAGLTKERAAKAIAILNTNPNKKYVEQIMQYYNLYLFYKNKDKTKSEQFKNEFINGSGIVQYESNNKFGSGWHLHPELHADAARKGHLRKRGY